MATVWQKSKVSNLIWHTGGRYYGRFTLAGKTKFIALHTGVFEVAKIQLARERQKSESTRKVHGVLANGEPTMGDLHRIYVDQAAGRAEVGEGTKTCYRQFADYIPKTWPEFAAFRPDQVTLEAVTPWRNRALTTGTGYRPKGAKGKCEGTRGNAAGTFNKAVDALRLMLKMAVDLALIHADPLLRRGVKAASNPRKPNLPEVTTLWAIFNKIERYAVLLLTFQPVRVKECGPYRRKHGGHKFEQGQNHRGSGGKAPGATGRRRRRFAGPRRGCGADRIGQTDTHRR